MTIAFINEEIHLNFYPIDRPMHVEDFEENNPDNIPSLFFIYGKLCFWSVSAYQEDN